MGWWQRDEDTTIGDGPLDIVEDFLQQLTTEYLDEVGRKPHLKEIMACIQISLEKRADEFSDDCDEYIITDIVAKTRKRPKKQIISPGDIFVIKYNDAFYYGRATPQADYYQFFRKVFDRQATITNLSGIPLIEFPFMLSDDEIVEWNWRIIGNIPFKPGEFQPKLFLFGDLVGYASNSSSEGFIDITANLRKATQEELRELPKYTVCPSRRFPERLKKALSEP